MEPARMTTDPGVVVVTGLGRCGTSLTMQMLAAGGIPTTPAHGPGYETEQTYQRKPIDPDWWAAQRGRAVKVLDPHINTIPRNVPVLVFVLTRDEREQALSQIKMGCFASRQAFDATTATRDRINGMRALLRRDHRAMRMRLPVPHHTLHFEDMVRKPRLMASIIASRLWPWFPAVDPDAMAAVVRKRPTTCLPYLLEMEMVDGT
jgi:hypothetical protein